MPQAIIAFLENTDFEGALRTSVFLGGDFAPGEKRALQRKKSVVEFEMENKIRRDFHGDFELLRCA